MSKVCLYGSQSNCCSHALKNANRSMQFHNEQPKRSGPSMTRALFRSGIRNTYDTSTG
uniref:Uncharacterized protein n=1 Tax=Anguilla anguilla TaxID=7936 RepID=A0A0E9WCG9_ANGAN